MVFGIIRLDLNTSAFIKIYWFIGFQSLVVCPCNRQLWGHGQLCSLCFSTLSHMQACQFNLALCRLWKMFNVCVFQEFAKTENFFRSAHLKNIKVDITCHTPFLDCFQMWRSIASTMGGSWEKIRFLSPMSAKVYRHSKKKTLQTARLNIMIIIRIYRT